MCQGQQESASLGYSPMPINLVQASFAQIAKIPGADVPTINIQMQQPDVLARRGEPAGADRALPAGLRQAGPDAVHHRHRGACGQLDDGRRDGRAAAARPPRRRASTGGGQAATGGPRPGPAAKPGAQSGIRAPASGTGRRDRDHRPGTRGHGGLRHLGHPALIRRAAPACDVGRRLGWSATGAAADRPAGR